MEQDRNPGRESEVNSKFQTIQAAHEILTDPEQRAKYDRQRRTTYNAPYSAARQARPNSFASGASNFPPPPKPPQYTTRPTPTSAGARRYANFPTPNGSTSKGGTDGAEARRTTHSAWESMRNRPPPKAPPKEYTFQPGQSGREESNAQKHGPPPRAKPGFKEFMEQQDAAQAAQSGRPGYRVPPPFTGPRKGFAPSTAGGDEPAAPNSASYSSRSTRRAPTAQRPAAPEPPPRGPPVLPMNNIDPLRMFREKAGLPAESVRMSTPYSTHGGEKTYFDSGHLSRSRSTREGGDKEDGDDTSSGKDRRQSFSSSPRSRRSEQPSGRADPGGYDGSSPPKRTVSDANISPASGRGAKPSKPRPHGEATRESDTSSDGDSTLEPRPRVFAKARPRGSHHGRYADSSKSQYSNIGA